ncbi:sigma-E processing peptidase SpoIIGA [Priestia koreensis]|uniref:sigma-E processing peptidase SpoIIGA n=1 Tax=Priestia koreensis TaxID=284581 RepID=UPI001F55E680|nr:sigma-E processing peptidase SpoIIGA [Priestia koreensis]MCM3003858.1 sigma-E processing peptidase SpoIIGA [Priestia koreensis]UNL83958.1 sigma-E processing peptidase SpoIIGA [Priestia koreensis]
MSVYLDVIWLLNFGLDTMLLVLCAIILKRRFKWWRMMIGGLFGSLIVIFMFTPLSQIMLHPATKIATSVVMILTAFGYKRLRYLLENLLTFYFATFVVGGGLMGMHFLFTDMFISSGGEVFTSSNAYGDPVSWLLVLLGSPLLFYFSKKRIEDVNMKTITFDQLVQVEIMMNDTPLTVDGLLDSGNQLYDPLTKTPVMIVQADQLTDLLPASIIESSANLKDFNFSIEPEWYNRIRLVPYRSVGQSGQFLMAVKPDYVTIIQQGERIVAKQCLIGISHTQLSPENLYQCVVHPKLLVSGKISSAS